MTKLAYSRWLDSVLSFLFLFNLFLYLFAFFLFAILSTLCTPNLSIKKTVTTTTTKTTTKQTSHYRTSLVNEKTIKQFYSKKYMLSTVIAIIKSITVTISQNDMKHYL